MPTRPAIGVAIPNCCEGLVFPAPFANHFDLMEMSREAEILGYESLWVNDHVTTQNYVRSAFKSPPNYYEPLITLTFMSSITTNPKLATGLLVLPLREPVILAKQISLLDLYSKGRLILAVGLGAYKEEFEHMLPRIPVRDRHILLDESIQALLLLMNERSASFEGKYICFRDIELYPKPAQKTIPLYIGGNSNEGLARVAKWGNGWLPASLSPLEIKNSLEKINQLKKKFGRENQQFDIAPQLIVSMAATKGEAIEKFRRSFIYDHLKSLSESTLKNQVARIEQLNLIGNADEIIDLMEEYLQAGVTHFGALVFACRTKEEYTNSMKEFAKEVMPSFR